ncbi:MAG TPA: RHS repeat-associated core domain-containing protein, partial [Flavobacterium sp.]
NSGYRFAFQGQELDPSTGMEAFQLRLWDGRIGRWLSPDPYGQHFSPYLGMGNNPVTTVDPDGGWETKFGRFLGWVSNGFRGSFTDNPDHATPNRRYGLRDTGTYTEEDGVVGVYIWTAFGGEKRDNHDKMANVLSNAWNSDFARSRIKDQYSFGISTQAAVFLGVGNTPINFTLLTRGEQGLYYTPSVGGSVGNGAEGSVTIAFSKGNYTGDSRDIKSSMLQGHAGGVSAGFGVAIVGSVGVSYAPVDIRRPISGGGFMNENGNIGFGLDLGSTGISGQVNYQYTPVVKPLITF